VSIEHNNKPVLLLLPLHTEGRAATMHASSMATVRTATHRPRMCDSPARQPPAGRGSATSVACCCNVWTTLLCRKPLQITAHLLSIQCFQEQQHLTNMPKMVMQG